jgi:ketosteroid isomerase-like protein
VRIRALALTLVSLYAFAPLHAGAHVQAQEAEVRAAVAETLAAWTSGRFETFAGFYHDDVHGFFLDGGPLTGGFSVAELEAARTMGFRTEFELEGLEVSVYDGVAASAGYLVGRLILPGGTTMDGTWRYTDTRILVDGEWKVVQFHFSQQQDPLG